MRWIVLVSLVGVWFAMVPGCGGGGSSNQESATDGTVLPEWFSTPEEAVGAELIPQDWLPEESSSGKFALSSSAFTHGGTIPSAHGCEKDGNFQKPSLPLAWKDAPNGTKSFVIVMDDLAPIAQEWVHWAVYNIPANVSSLSTGASGKNMPTGAKELKNTWQLDGYGGPCPPTDIHTYRIRIFAMSKETITLQSAEKSSAITAQLQDVLGVAELRGNYL